MYPSDIVKKYIAKKHKSMEAGSARILDWKVECILKLLDQLEAKLNEDSGGMELFKEVEVE